MSMMPPPQNNNSGHRRCRRRRFSRTITVPMTPIYVLVAVTAILALAPPKSLFVMAGNDDDAANDDADNNYNNAPASYDDVYSSSYANANNPYASDGSILYWTEFALFPKRCVNWNGIDQIKYDMYEKSSKHCSDTPLGTYLTPVPTFVNAYLSQLAANAQDAGYDDYEAPVNAATYATCTAGPVINGVQHYLQVGCAENNPLALAVNYYSDNTCQTASKISDGSGSSYNNNYDIQLDINLPFQKCTPCVIWMDKNDDEVDDQYYVNKQTYAPLCTSVWNYKEECNGKCQKKTKYNVREGWNRADKVLLTILSFFGEYIYRVGEGIFLYILWGVCWLLFWNNHSKKFFLHPSLPLSFPNKQ